MDFDQVTDLAFAEDTSSEPQIDLKNDKVIFPPYVRPKYLGTRTKLTVEIERELCAIIARGCYAVAAAQSVGITSQTFYNWKNRYPEFAAAIEAAEGKAEQTVADTVARQNPTFWLERGPAKKRWRKEEAVEHTGNEQSPGTVKLEAVLSVEELKTLLQMREKLDTAEKMLTEKRLLEAKPAQGETLETHSSKP